MPLFSLVCAAGCTQPIDTKFGDEPAEPARSAEQDASAGPVVMTGTGGAGQDAAPIRLVTPGTGGASDAVEPGPPYAAGGDGGGGEDSGLAGAGGQLIDLGIGKGDLTLLLVFDKSGSMASNWDGRPKWQAASDALIAGMEPFLDNLTVAAIFFPQPDDCEVVPLDNELQIQYLSGRDFVRRWSVTGAVTIPNGSTPMQLAFEVADQAVIDAERLGLLQDRFRLIVVTDGEPNCGTEPSALAPYAARWTELGVETHVLGLPGSQTAIDLLDGIAQAGGTGAYVAPSDPTQLEETFHALAE